MRKGSYDPGRTDCCFCERETVSGDEILIFRDPSRAFGNQVVRAHAAHFILAENPKLAEMIQSLKGD